MDTTRAIEPGATKSVDEEILIVGAGFSGIGMGIELDRRGIHDFTILESAPDLGGTWRDNTYPGIAVDITSFTYSYSYEPNPRWSRVFAPGNELLAYAHHCAEKYDVKRHMRFGVRVARARFDRDGHRWIVTLDDGRTITTRFLVGATGALTQPKKPAIPGIDAFRGVVVHPARWDHSLDFAGKRVAVIGTGATAVQLVPELARQVASLDVYQRTPIWILPKKDVAIPDAMKELFERMPVTQRMLRLATNLATEVVMVVGVVYNRQTPWLVRRIERIARAHLEAQVRDPVLRAKLTPRYGFGCKRPSVSNDYLRTFEQPHVTLVTEPIARIDPTGVVDREGTHRPIDILVLATGFNVFERGNLPTYELVGANGRDLGEYWDSERYQAYQGASVPGYPNFFTILGPYGTTGASWFAMVEAQTTHASRCIEEARRVGATWVEVRDEAHRAYFREVLRRQKNTVFFNNGCATSNSYYFDRHGDAPFLRPASGLEMHWRAHHFPLDHYRFVTR